MKKRIPNQGYTIIEVLIAMSIFAIGFLAVAKMEIMSINQNAHARMQTEATVKAVDRLERLMALPYDHTDLNEGWETPTAEMMLHTFKNCLQSNLPYHIDLVRVRLYETATSYAEWRKDP